MILPSSSVCNNSPFFISSVFSFSSAHSHIFCVTSNLLQYAASCHAVFPLMSVRNHSPFFISSVVSFYSANSHIFCVTSNLPQYAAYCQAVLPLKSVRNNSPFLSHLLLVLLHITHIFSTLHVLCPHILQGARRSFP